MINITNGVNHMTCTAGAFKEIFAPQGWTRVDTAESSQVGVSSQGGTSVDQEEEEVEEDELETAGDDSDEESEDEDEESEADEDLSEKPLGEMSYEELQRFAKLSGLDITGMRSKKEIRQALRNQ